MKGACPGPGALAASASEWITDTIATRIKKRRAGGRDRGDQGNVKGG
jgi:hypothetical protein